MPGRGPGWAAIHPGPTCIRVPIGPAGDRLASVAGRLLVAQRTGARCVGGGRKESEVIDSVQSYPCAERLSLVEQVHGRSVADPYRWLEDSSTAETKDWSRAQDDLWLTYAGTLSSRFRWKNRVRQLSEVSSVSTPVWRGGRCFTLRREPGRQPVLFVDETPLIDPKRLDSTGLTTLDAWQPSPDGTKLAYQLSRGGDERSTLTVVDVTTGERTDG